MSQVVHPWIIDGTITSAALQASQWTRSVQHWSRAVARTWHFVNLIFSKQLQIPDNETKQL
jgi:hypothetical protein